MSSARKGDGSWPLSEAKARISELVRLAQREPQRVQVSGEPAGAFISEKDLQLLMSIKKQRMARMLERIIRSSQEEGVHSEDFGELRGPIKDIELK
jgi:prevent-host-death family protein